MEISKNDTKVLKGIAILLMLLLHLFCRKDSDGMYTTFLSLDGVPLLYYLALLGDACRPIYLFLSGYAFYIVINKQRDSILGKNIRRILKLACNYWIVLIIFVSLGFLMGLTNEFPGSVSKFLLNFFMLSNSYNGAWWFIQVYIILVLMSPFIVKFVSKFNPFVILGISGVIYLLSYVQRYKEIISFGDSEILNMIFTSVLLLGTSQFSFLVGMIFAKNKIYSKIHNKFNSIKYKNIICTAGIVSLILFHSIVETAIIAPINGILLVNFILLMDKSALIEKGLTFLSEHSTNIWLTHMFFYMTIFPNLTFAPNYPILIYIWLFILCIATSYVIKFIHNPIAKLIDNKFTVVTVNNRKVPGQI